MLFHTKKKNQKHKIIKYLVKKDAFACNLFQRKKKVKKKRYFHSERLALVSFKQLLEAQRGERIQHFTHKVLQKSPFGGAL